MDVDAAWMPWVAVGGACATACWVLASRQGRAPLAHAALGFLPPLVGVIAVAVVPPRDVRATA